MALKYGLVARTNRMNQLNTDIGTSAILTLVTATRPGNVANALTGTRVANFTCNASSFAAILNGVLTANPFANAVASAGGTVTHFRLFKSDGTTGVIDGDVSTTGADLNLDNNIIASGQTVSISSFAITAAGF